MKMLFAFAASIGMMALTACATLTGDPAKDCLVARNSAIQAQSLDTLTHAIAVANPTSVRDAQAAALADAALAAAQAQQTAACPAP